jgi:hypothetical protein
LAEVSACRQTPPQLPPKLLILTSTAFPFQLSLKGRRSGLDHRASLRMLIWGWAGLLSLEAGNDVVSMESFVRVEGHGSCLC